MKRLLGLLSSLLLCTALVAAPVPFPKQKRLVEKKKFSFYGKWMTYWSGTPYEVTLHPNSGYEAYSVSRCKWSGTWKWELVEHPYIYLFIQERVTDGQFTDYKILLNVKTGKGRFVDSSNIPNEFDAFFMVRPNSK